MRTLVALAGCTVLLSGCGAASDVSNLITSTPSSAALAVAEATVQDGNTAMSAYFAANGSYAGATTSSLLTMQPGLSPTVSVTSTADAYCIESVVDGVTASVRGPGSAAPGPGAC